jgi:hypothetical protein
MEGANFAKEQTVFQMFLLAGLLFRPKVFISLVNINGIQWYMVWAAVLKTPVGSSAFFLW